MDDLQTSTKSKDDSPIAKTSKTNDDSEELTESKERPNDGSSSPARCPICLAPPQNAAQSGSCSHNFCFDCLKEWCNIKAECPLCKMPIHSIFYNIKSDTEYDEYKIKKAKPDIKYRMLSMPGLPYNWFQSNFRRAYFRRRRESELALEAANNVVAVRTRRMYYWNKSRVLDVDTGNRVRECSAEFFRENPSQIHRLVPWLQRELTVLYGARNKTLIDHVFKKILDIMPYLDIDSRGFKNVIRAFMLEYTDHFIHEFQSFASSPYDVVQYDRKARYSTNANEQPAGRHRRSRHSKRRKSHRRRETGRSRWDNSPGATPLGASAQSMMLSHTSWSEEPPQNPILSGLGLTRHPDASSHIHGQPITNPSSSDAYMNANNVGLGFNLNPAMPYPVCNPLAHRWVVQPNMGPEFDAPAPLQQQTIDLYPHGATSARQYQSMERIRQHIGDFQRNRSVGQHMQMNQHNRGLQDFPKTEAPTNNAIPTIIVISDSSEDENAAGTSTIKSGSKTIHYKPVEDGSKIPKMPTGKRIRVKVEESRHRSSSSDTSKESINSESDSDSSGIEFVRYIKPPHLRTPDAFINLSSSDNDTPGPSSKLTAVIRPHNSTSHVVSSSPEDRERRIHPNEILQRTRDFLQQARQSVYDTDADNIAPNDRQLTVQPQTSASSVISSSSSVEARLQSSQVACSTLFPRLSAGGNETDDQLRDTRCAASSRKVSIPKKIFERGKVSINFPSSKRPFSSSDSEVDVDYIEEVSATHNHSRPSQNEDWFFHDGHRELERDSSQTEALQSLISIAENQGSPRPESCNHKESHIVHSRENRIRMSRESSEHEKRKKKKRKRSKCGELDHVNNSTTSKRHKKHKKIRHHRRSRSSSVEFVRELR